GAAHSCVVRPVSARATLVEIAERLRLAGRVVGVEPADAESAGLDDGGDVAVEVATAADLLLDAVEPVLPGAHAFVGGASVLDEVQRAAWFEHAPHLRDSGGRIRNRAQ